MPPLDLLDAFLCRFEHGHLIAFIAISAVSLGCYLRHRFGHLLRGRND